MRALEHKVPPPVVGTLIAAAMWALSLLTPSLAPPLELPQSVGGPLTVMLVMAGVTFDLLGLIAFLRMKTTINPLQPAKASALVTGGVYRITRNPMYVGMALLLTAQVHDEDTARAIQLMIEYDPQPPFDAGSTAKAGPLVVDRLRRRHSDR